MTEAWRVLTGDKVAVVAVHAVVGGTIVDRGRAAAVIVNVILGSVGLLRNVEVRNISAAV
jgi:hypothetical protein